MRRRIEKSFHDKREGMVYVVIFLWVVLGILGITYQAELEHVGIYFLAMTALVGSYIWGESVRKSNSTSIFIGGKNSRREAALYITILLWLVLGVWGIVTYSDLLSISAYFASLSPFVSAYILGETYKPVRTDSLRPNSSGGEKSAYRNNKKEEYDNYPSINDYNDSDEEEGVVEYDNGDVKDLDGETPEPDINSEDLST